LRPHPTLGYDEARIALAALLYGRMLLAHAETRSELYGRVAAAARAAASDGVPFDFAPWTLPAGDGQFVIWPWQWQSPDTIDGKIRTYVATLRGDRKGGLWAHVKMAWGLERVLAPSSALLALQGLSRELPGEDRRRLALVVLAMHAYYGSPECAASLRSDVRAVEAALPSLTSETE
jgi:hypothetical protein